MKLRTLVIDDSEADVDFLRHLLRQASSEQGFTVTWEANPERAAARLQEETFDLVLLDYQMPTVNGLALLPELRAVDRLVPIIMLTGQGNEAVAVQAIQRGAHDYLRKDQLTVSSMLCAILTALDRHRLELELARQKEAQESDLRLARELQQAFLPDSFPHFAPQQRPDSVGLRVYHRYTPTLAVGGDFFEIVPVNAHTAGVFIADVAGHGLQAALVTAVLRTLIEEHKEVAGDGAEFLTRLNAGLYRILNQTTAPLYASAFYVTLDGRAGQLSFSSAQHPPQLHLRRQAGEVVPLHDPSKTGPLLGEVEHAVYPVRRVPLAADDAVVLFTDELVELRNPAGDRFGMHRLQAAARQALAAPPDKLVEKLVAAAGAHTGAAILSNELCVVAVEAGGVGK